MFCKNEVNKFYRKQKNERTVLILSFGRGLNLYEKESLYKQIN